MIAKRYTISIEALCNANGITRRDKIRPGQKLYVPRRSDVDGSETRRLVLGEPEPIKAAGALPAAGKSAAGKSAGADNIVASKSSRTETDTKSNADRLLKVAPARAALPTRGTVAKGKPGASWATYTKPANKKGYVVLNATGRNWKGYAIVKGNRLSSNAQGGFDHALYSWRTGAQSQISPALIRLLTKVSDAFGGRPLRVVSGYREHSHFKESRHKLGHACDFSIVGVPNNVLRDYLMTLDGVGVGYYPNSSFVHLDVRRIKTTWIDFSGPGERPRSKRERSRPPASKVPTVGDFSSVPLAPSRAEAEDEDAPIAASPWPRVDPAHSAWLASTFNHDDPSEIAPKAKTEGMPTPAPKAAAASAAGATPVVPSAVGNAATATPGGGMKPSAATSSPAPASSSSGARTTVPVGAK
jgi:uncharacterized protein YcbK (DUF882 family)